MEFESVCHLTILKIPAISFLLTELLQALYYSTGSRKFNWVKPGYMKKGTWNLVCVVFQCQNLFCYSDVSYLYLLFVNRWLPKCPFLPNTKAVSSFSLFMSCIFKTGYYAFICHLWNKIASLLWPSYWSMHFILILPSTLMKVLLSFLWMRKLRPSEVKKLPEVLS